MQIRILILALGFGLLTACASNNARTPDLASFNTEPTLPTGGSDAAMAAAKTY